MIDQTISHYKILEKLGAGGMGEVYKAEDTKLKRTVALKFLPPHLTKDEEANARFMTEAQAASALDHQNICTIFDIKETDDEQLFIVMAYYDGETLAQKIIGAKHSSKNSVTSLNQFAKNASPLPIDNVIDIASQIAAGLARAHEAGITHRDIKPSNIMITEHGEVKILDFGIARIAGQRAITKTGSTLGTVAYMSPEQVRGEQTDHRTDIWSLGVVLYEMLTGQQPFQGEYDHAVMYSICNQPHAPVAAVREDVPERIAQIVDKTLAKKADERYQDEDEMLADLQGDSKAVSAKRSFSKPATTRKATQVWLLPALIFSMIVLAFAGYFFFGKQAENTERIPIAVVGFENMTGDTTYNYLQKAIPSLLITSLEQSPNLQVATWERLRDLLKQTGKEYREIIDKDTGYELCRMDGVDIIVLGSFTKAGDMFATDVKVLNVSTKALVRSATARGEGLASILKNQIDDLSREISKGVGLAETRIAMTQRPIADVTTSSMEAYNYFIRGREYYEKYYEADAMRLFERAIELDSTFATARIYLARVYWNRGLGQYSHFEKAMAYSKAVPEKERLFIESDYARINEQNPEKADSILQQILQKYPKEKRVRHDLGLSYERRGLYDEAIAEFSQIISLDPYYARAYNRLGYCYAYKGDFAKAIDNLQRYAALSPGEANPLDSMAEVYLGMGDVDAAITKFEEVQAIKPDFPSLYWRLGYAYALAENYSEAISVLDKHLDMYPHALTWTYRMRGFYQYLRGQVRRAWQDLKRACEVADSTGHQFGKPRAELLRGWIYYDRGEFDSGRIAMQNFVDGRMEVNPERESYYKLYLNSYLGLVKVKLGEIDSAKYHLEAMEANLPLEDANLNELSNFRYDLLHAEILLAEGSADKALAVVQKAKLVEYPIAMNPIVFDYNLPFKDDISARAYQKLGDLDGTIAEYERLTRIDQSHRDRRFIQARFHYSLAKLYEQKGLTEKAMARYEHFLTVWKDADPDWPELIDAKARYARLKGSTKK